MILRDYAESDGPATLDVFLRAIRVTAARDYTPEQVAAWASDVPGARLGSAGSG